MKNVHIIAANPEDAWRKGWGWFARVRAMAGLGFVDILAAGGAWRVVGWQIGLGIVALGLAALLGMLIFRRYRRRSAYIGIRLHGLFDVCRKECRAIRESATKGDASGYQKMYRAFHSMIANHIASFFKDLTGESAVECAIRLAEEAQSEIVYSTAGRSLGMNPARNRMSEAISAREGIAQHLRQSDQCGVWHIRDIQEAIKMCIWKPTKTDHLSDVRTLLVAPINAEIPRITPGISGTSDMLGILYITSPSNTFERWHTEYVAAFAQMLGMIYLSITVRFPSLNEEDHKC